MTTIDDAVSTVYFIFSHILGKLELYKLFCLGLFPYSAIILPASNAINASLRLFNLTRGKPELYWLHSLLLVILTGFGGGFVAPALLGKAAMPLSNDVVIPLCIIAWYTIFYLKLGGVFDLLPIKLIWSVLLGVFRTNSVCSMTKTAAATLVAGPYYPIALIGPIVAGTVIGSAGAFLPFDKGLSPISNGTPWPIQGAFIAATFYHLMIHDSEGILGNALRSIVGTYSETDTRTILSTLQIVTLLGQVLFDAEANLLTPAHKFFYLVFQLEGPTGAHKKKGALDTVGWDYNTRLGLERFIEVFRVAFVIFVAAAHLYITSPSPSAAGYCEAGAVEGTCKSR